MRRRNHGDPALTLGTDGAWRCAECGFVAGADGERCADRWHALLALDHSRQEPWGALHGVAFAVWSLQHPATSGRATVERAWWILHAILVEERRPDDVFRALRQASASGSPAGASTGVPPLASAPPPRFRATIASLGAFDAERYRALLWDWARATYDDWRSVSPG